MREGRDVRISDKEFPCPCCGYMSFDEPPGSYSICQICFWEDDAVQLRFPDCGGANPPLRASQVMYQQCGAVMERLVPFVRQPLPEDVKDPKWRPLSSDLEPDWMPEQEIDYFAAVCSSGTHNTHYYWQR